MPFKLHWAALAPLLVIASCSSGGEATTAMAETDQLCISMVSGNVNIGSWVQASAVSLSVDAKEGNEVTSVKWTFWNDKNGNGEMDRGEEIDSGDDDDMSLGDLSFRYSERFNYKITYSATSSGGGSVNRTTSIGSLF